MPSCIYHIRFTFVIGRLHFAVLLSCLVETNNMEHILCHLHEAINFLLCSYFVHTCRSGILAGKRIEILWLAVCFRSQREIRHRFLKV